MTTKQVLFVDPAENDVNMGILVNDEYVICACCGGVYEIDEILIIREYDFWVNFNEEICDNLDLLLAKEIAEKYEKDNLHNRQMWVETIKRLF